MKLTWHIVKKDLVRLRLALLLWVGLLAGQVLASEHLLAVRSADFSLLANLGMRVNLLVAVGLLVGFILAAALVLDDPLVGTDMSWVTRPISGGRLLGAKLTGALLVLVVLPVLIWIPWWLYCGFNSAQLASAAARIFYLQAMAVVPGFVLASLVGQAGRFVLFGVLGLAVLLLGSFNIAYWADVRALPPELLQTRLLLALAVALACAIGVVWRQFLTRKFISSAVGLGVGLLLATAVILCWPWNLARPPAASHDQVAGSERIAGKIVGARVASLPNVTAPENYGVSIEVRFAGVPDTFSLGSGVADAELRWPDGTVVRGQHLRVKLAAVPEVSEQPAALRALGLPPTQPWVYHWDSATDARMTQLVEAARQRLEKSGRHWPEPRRLAPGQPVTVTELVTMPVTPEIAARVKAEPPACSISMRVTTQHPVVLLEMPVVAGTSKAGAGARLHIAAIEQSKWFGVAHEPTKAFVLTVTAASAPDLSGLSLYAVDRQHGTAACQGRTFFFSRVPVADHLEGLYAAVIDPLLWRNDAWVEPPDWLDSVTLAAMAFKDAGGFNRDLAADRLTLQPEEGEQ